MTAPEKLDWSAVLDTALTMPGRMGDTYTRFYDYSYLNQILLMMQGVAEPVATFKRWQAMGRQVRKGSKARYINRPWTGKRTGSDGKEEKFVGFKLVNCLFPLSDTDGSDLPVPEIPDWDMDRALAALDARRIPYTLTDGNTQGFSRHREFAINPVAVHPLSTMFHELGHILLGHTDDAGMAEYTTHRGRMEFQAEAVSHLVTIELGLVKPDDDKAAESRAYIQNWLGSEAPTDTHIRSVFKAVEQILAAGRPAKAVKQESEAA